jgi:hypothetical protein
MMCDNSRPFHAVFERNMWASSANILFHWFDGQSCKQWYTDQDDFASDLCGEGLDIASLFNLRHKDLAMEGSATDRHLSWTS